jgi:hypothetical protein
LSREKLAAHASLPEKARPAAATQFVGRVKNARRNPGLMSGAFRVFSGASREFQVDSVMRK